MSIATVHPQPPPAGDTASFNLFPIINVFSLIIVLLTNVLVEGLYLLHCILGFNSHRMAIVINRIIIKEKLMVLVTLFMREKTLVV